MNIKELKELIKDLPDDMLVVLYEDILGSGYYEASSVDEQCLCEADEDISKEHVLLIS